MCGGPLLAGPWGIATSAPCAQRTRAHSATGAGHTSATVRTCSRTDRRPPHTPTLASRSSFCCFRDASSAWSSWTADSSSLLRPCTRQPRCMSAHTHTLPALGADTSSHSGTHPICQTKACYVMSSQRNLAVLTLPTRKARPIQSRHLKARLAPQAFRLCTEAVQCCSTSRAASLQLTCRASNSGPGACRLPGMGDCALAPAACSAAIVAAVAAACASLATASAASA